VNREQLDPESLLKKGTVGPIFAVVKYLFDQKNSSGGKKHRR